MRITWLSHDSLVPLWRAKFFTGKALDLTQTRMQKSQTELQTNSRGYQQDKERAKYKYQSEIQQMMFVFGEVADPWPETTMLVEDIVRSQVIEIVCPFRLALPYASPVSSSCAAG